MAGRLSDQWLDELRSRLNIVDVVSEYVQLNKKGSRYWGLCPFHNEKTASFSVNPEQQIYYCFGCHKGGNVIHFVMEMERMEFLESVKLLAERAHMTLPERTETVSPEDSRLREAVYAANKAAARYYHDLIWTQEGASALKYLHNRGLDDSVIRRFGLGATGAGWEELTKTLLGAGFEEETLVRAGLTVKKENRRYDMFRERVMFPIINARGMVLGFGGRAMGDANPKYLNTADTVVFNNRMGLYAMNFVAKERGLKRLILVEGYMDVVSMRRVGIPGVVATLGTALTQEQARLLKRYAPEVWVGYDGDAAGQKAILRALDIFDALEIPARVLSFPDGMDPDDFVRKVGPAGFEEQKPMRPVEYRMLRVEDGLDLAQTEDRAKYAMLCCELLHKIANPVETEMYVNQLALKTGFTREALMEQIGVSFQKPQTGPPRRSARRPQREETQLQRTERTLVLLLANALVPSGIVTPGDFEDPTYRDMVEWIRSGADSATLMERVGEQDREKAASALNDEALPDRETALRMAEDCIEKIRRWRRERERAQWREELKTADAARRAELIQLLDAYNRG